MVRFAIRPEAAFLFARDGRTVGFPAPLTNQDHK
jgi:hypothetical protein